MSQPATTPTWATDSTFSSGPKAGSPTKVTPSGGVLSQGEVPGQTYKGEKINWIFFWICSWIAYLKDLHNDTYFLGRSYLWSAVHYFNATGDIAYSPARARNTQLSLLHSRNLNVGATTFNLDMQPVFTSNAIVHVVAFKAPVNAVITGYTVNIVVGSASSETTTTRLMARGKAGTGSAAVAVGATSTVSAIGARTHTVTGLTETASDDTWYWLECTTTDASGAGAVATARVQWNTVTPGANLS